MWPASSVEFVSILGEESGPGSPSLAVRSFLFSSGVHKDLNLQRGKLCDWPISSG